MNLAARATRALREWQSRWRRERPDEDAAGATGFGARLRQYLLLRPYGDNLLTPAVTVWLGFAWVVIALMASIEGVVWGLVGASIVPREAALLRLPAGLFLFALMFAIVWIVDASLIMSERPTRTLPGTAPREDDDNTGAQIRWFLGVAARVIIVAVSLYVTAPFLAKLIRAEDIASWHQRQVERYFAERDAWLQARIAENAAPLEAAHRAQVADLEARVAQLSQAVTEARARRARIEAEYAPELAVLRTELAEAQRRFGDELHGRNERREGYGPQAQLWEARAKQLAATIDAKQRESAARLGDDQRLLIEQERQLDAANAQLQELRRAHQQRIDEIVAQTRAQQPEAAPPRLTFAARSKALQALRDSPDERGVPHFETVEGFAQAALGILFCALLALKLFEPAAVRAYFNEALQYRYRKYLHGGLADIPGFETAEDPVRRLDPIEFAQLWRRYAAAPETFYADQRALTEVRAPALERLEEQSFRHALQTQRRNHLREETEHLRQRRALDLAAYREELRLRTEQLQTVLNDEAQARRDNRYQTLATELERARAAWELQKAREETDLQERAEALARARQEQRQQAAESAVQARIERLRAELRQLEEQATRWRHEREQRAAQLNALAQEQEALDERQRALDERCATHSEQLFSLRARIAALGGAGGGWLARSPADAVPLRRELKEREKAARADAQQLERCRADARALAARRLTAESEWRDLDARLTALATRQRLLEDKLDTALGEWAMSVDAPGQSRSESSIKR